jgi:ABC-2 type transport system ATP-binding protein
MDAIEIRGVTKTFATVTAVNDLSLAVPEGSIYGFIGPNGSGKTTSMRMITGIFHPDRGTIRIFGKEISTDRSGLIGYLPEERGLYKKMKVAALLEFHAKLLGGRDAARQVSLWLKKVDLAHCASLPLEALSKGMSQKVQFIAAIIPERGW